MSKEVEFDLKSAILQTGLLQPVSSSMKGCHLEILCRQVPGREQAWLKVVQAILIHLEGANPHICRRYILKDGKMVFGWHIQLDAPNKKGLAQIAGDLKTVLEISVQGLEDQEVAEEPPPAPAGARPAQASNPGYVHVLEGVVGGKDGASRGPPIRGRGAPRLPPQPPPSSRPLAPGQRPPNRMPPPRAPGQEAGVDEAPADFTPRIKIIRTERGIIAEMPLPHTFHELNVPNEKGRGAKYTVDQ